MSVVHKGLSVYLITQREDIVKVECLPVSYRMYLVESMNGKDMIQFDRVT